MGNKGVSDIAKFEKKIQHHNEKEDVLGLGAFLGRLASGFGVWAPDHLHF